MAESLRNLRLCLQIFICTIVLPLWNTLFKIMSVGNVVGTRGSQLRLSEVFTVKLLRIWLSCLCKTTVAVSDLCLMCSWLIGVRVFSAAVLEGIYWVAQIYDRSCRNYLHLCVKTLFTRMVTMWFVLQSGCSNVLACAKKGQCYLFLSSCHLPLPLTLYQCPVVIWISSLNWQ